MKIAIIQEAGIHLANCNFRECLCLKRAFERHPDVTDVTVWGPRHPAFRDESLDWNKFDIIIMIENYSHSWVPDLSKTTHPIKFMWSIDSHVMDVHPHKKIFEEGKYHYFLQATSIFCDRVKNHDGSDSIWFPNAYDDALFFPKEGDFDKKRTVLGFCGSQLNRGEICEKIAKKMPFTPDYWRLGNDMVELIRSYKIHLNLNMNWDVNYRNFETCGIGTVLLTNNDMNEKDYENLGFRHGINCLFWNSRDDESLFRALNEFKDDDVALKKIGENGHKLVSSYHTYYNRVIDIMNLYEGKDVYEYRQEYPKSPR